ncbi:MAG TPA: alpha/beta hydrolase [Allosphingosinicella sp.]|jgi:pimeloyl-ACP methyl ester carboxylesterase
MKIIAASLLPLCLVAASPAAASQATPAVAAAPVPVVQMEHISIEAVGSGPPLVLIPGLASPREVYRPFVDELARTGRVLLVQVNGFGGDPPRGNAAEGVLPGVVADIARYLEQNRLGPAVVVGHSMGGVIGMLLARDHPARIDRLMIVDSLPFFGSMVSPDLTVEAIRPSAEAMRAAIRNGMGRDGEPSATDPSVQTMSYSPEGRLQVARWVRGSDPAVVGQAMYETATTDMRPHLTAIGRVPTTVLYAVPPSLVERAHALWRGQYAPAPSIRLVPVENSHHFIMLDQPERFRSELRTFLQAPSAPRAGERG